MKNKYIGILLLVLALASVQNVEAYNLGIKVDKYGWATYSSPAVLGEEDKQETEKPEDNKKEEQKTEEKRETPKVERPEKIEIKKSEKSTTVKLSEDNKVKQELKLKNTFVKYTTNSKVGDTEKEEIQIQSEVHDDGKVEIQIESKQVKAKIKDTEIELDLKNHNIGTTNDEGKKIELIHLPDQAVEKLMEIGATMDTETLEVGRSGDNYEYTIDAVKKEKLLGLFPVDTKFKLTLDDTSGTVTQKEVANNIIETIINLFSF